MLWLYTIGVHGVLIEKEIEKTLAKLVPGAPTTERSKFETYVLVYFCADRQGIESMKRDVAVDICCLICWFKKKDMDGDFAAFVEDVYNDIPAKDDPLRVGVTAETLKRVLSLKLWWVQYIDDDGDDDGDDDSDKDALKRIMALIEANEPSAWEMAHYFDNMSKS